MSGTGRCRPTSLFRAELRASLHLKPDPERARRLEQAASSGGGVLQPGLAWPKLAAIGCWKGGTVGAYLARFDTLFPQRPPVRDFGYYATELRGSVPLSDQGDAGAVAVGTNVLEFYPAGDDRAPEGRELCRSSGWRKGSAISSTSPAPRGSTATT